jgi:uncharacterized RDD family membrane protein YckC
MLPLVPRIPNRYDDDEQRLRRLERQERESAARLWAVLLCGVALLALLVPLALIGWSGAGLLLLPLSLGMILGAGIQLALARFAA